MKVIESWPFYGYTTLRFDGLLKDKLFIPGYAVEIDGVVYPRVSAHDIGPRIAIKGEYNFVGKEAKLIYERPSK